MGNSWRFTLMLLCTIIISNNFLSSELFTPMAVFFGLIIVIFGKINGASIKLVAPLIALFLIGFIGMYGHDLRDIFRDSAFSLTPIFLIIIGYWMAVARGITPHIVFKIMMTVGFGLAIVHLSTFILNPALLGAESMEIRTEAGSTPELVGLAFVIGLFGKRFGMNGLFPGFLPRLLVMPVLLASILLSFSRTEYVVVIILSLSLLGWLSRIDKRFVISMASIAIGFILLAVTTPADEEYTFRSKIVRSVTEVAVSDYQDIVEIGKNWRGFEAHRAIETFRSGNAWEHVFGQGFGALVDLGFDMALGGEGDVEFRYIPITHNGYVYILIKAGLLGLICYALFYIGVIRYAARFSDSNNIEQKFLSRLLLGCVLSLVFIMLVVGGMAEAHGAEFVLLVGYLQGWLSRIKSIDCSPKSFGRHP
jgi:O-antigen ligase